MGRQHSNRSRFAGLVQSIGLHEHLCFVYETQKQQFSAAVPFMQTGLERGEKCLYITKEPKDSKAFLEAMRAQRLNVDDSIEKGSLAVVLGTDPPLKKIVNPNGMIRFLTGVVKETKTAGFPALRFVGEMTWALNLPNTDRFLIEFEAKLDIFLRENDALAICQYNRKIFPPEAVLGVLRTHPTVVYSQFVSKNPYYVRPEELLHQGQGEKEVQRLLKNIRAYESKERERQRAEEEVRRLSGRILQLQDEERQSIARDLHDSTGQDLVALATMIGQVRSSVPSVERKPRRLLSECRALAERCIREVRTLSYLLHPPVLDEAGLGDAIHDYVKGFTKRSGIRVELELSPRLGRMARDVELTLFRVVQESLTNIQRHSGSQQAKIRIHRNSNLMLEISDRGQEAFVSRRKGKEEPRLEGGVGIPSMQERVKLIGGRLDIDSTSHGTTVRVTIPLGGER
jgi:signal transduction histidine kinase